MCRSEPQMFADVIRTSTSVGRSIRASGTSLTLTFRGPSYTTAFMLPPRLGLRPTALGPRLDYTRRGLGVGIGRHANTDPADPIRSVRAKRASKPPPCAQTLTRIGEPD